jgi:sugar phosphate isomerase/epimerase
MKKVSVGTWAYIFGPYTDKPVPFDTCLQKIKALGFDGLELGAWPPHPTPQEFDTPEKRAALKKKIADAGLGISGLAIDFHGQYPFQDDEAAYLAEFEKNLQFCADLGIKTIRVDTDIAPNAVSADNEKQAIEKTIKVWKACARKAAEQGIRLVWEFEPGFAFNKPSQILQIVQGVGEPNFGVMYDTCHAHMVAGVGARQPGTKETLPGGALELLQKLQGHIGAIHVIDSDGSLHGDETSTHNPFGEGDLNFDELIPALLKSGAPTDWWCIDLCFWPEAWDATEKCKRALDGLLAKHDR